MSKRDELRKQNAALVAKKANKPVEEKDIVDEIVDMVGEEASEPEEKPVKEEIKTYSVVEKKEPIEKVKELPLPERRKAGRPPQNDEPLKSVSLKMPESYYNNIQAIKFLYGNSVTNYILGLINADFKANGEKYQPVIDKYADFLKMT